MSDLSVELTAPNGRKYIQPTGLFINNEWVKSSNEQKLTTINPTYAIPPHHHTAYANPQPAMSRKSPPSTPPRSTTSTQP